MTSQHPGSSAPDPRRFSAGAGRASIDLPESLLPLEGFTTVHDPLEVRVVLLRTAQEELALVVVDQTALGPIVLGRVRAIVGEECSVDPDRVVVCVSHTFSAPHLADTVEASPLLGALERAVRASAADAVAGLQPAGIGIDTGTTDVNVNRDVPTRSGWWLGADPSGFAPREVAVVSIRALSGRPIAFLVNCSVQPSVMNGSVGPDGGRQVTADLAGAACRFVEAEHPGSVAAFLIGAAGDQSPRLTAVRGLVDADGDWSSRDAGPAAHLLTELLGERLGAEVVRTAATTTGLDTAPDLMIVRDEVRVSGQRTLARELLRPSTTYAFQPAGPESVAITVIRIGAIALAGVAPELNAVTGEQIRQASPIASTVVLTMLDGAAKYAADEQSFDRITYEAMSSRFTRGSAEAVRDGLVALLTRSQNAPRRTSREP